MWEDLPKKSPPGTKIAIVISSLLVLATLGYVGYILIKSQNSTREISQSSSPSPKISAKLSSSPRVSPSPTPSASSQISPSAIDYNALHIPEGETYFMSSAADTNGDSKDETLVITKTSAGKYHAYVLSSDGKSLFDNKDLGQKPLRIATQTYDSTKETYLSWMLVFTEESGNLALIHWNGTAYEIPPNMGI